MLNSGDNSRATFFYTADKRVDFRELIREYSKEFGMRIEMRHFGARQESAKIGELEVVEESFVVQPG